MKQTIARRTNDNSVPLSFAQQRLWFLNQLDPNNPVYNVYRAWRLSGKLNVEVLQRAVDTVVARHQVLRATFKVVNGQPIQVTAPALSVPLSIVDLQELSPAEREVEALQLALREAKLPFDLERGPLFRVKLLRLAAEDHILLVNLHHIVSDGWTLGVLHRELAALYEAFIAGRPSHLPDLPLQYSDYSVWQRDWLQGDILKERLTYWKRQLASLPVLELPTDRSRLAAPTYQGARETFRLSPTLTAQLKVLSQREGITLFMTLLGAVNVLLHRYSGQDDIVVGTPIANRTRAELEPLIGMFVNTLVLRTDLSGDPCFRELLARVREMALAAYTYQDMPFEKLVEELQPERDMSRHPLFQVAFTLQTTPDQVLAFSGMKVTPFSTGSVAPFNTGNGTAKFDLTISMIETDGVIAVSLEYSTDLFDRTTILRMAGHLQTLLGGIAANPNRRLSELPILTDAERRQLLMEWNDTQREYPREKCIHQLFEEQAERTPEAIAVIFEDQRLTYEELNRRANHLAHYLRKLGVGPEVLVGICMERSLEMVVGLLGILKAGGAYVPLDSDYPKERLAFMLEDSGASVLVTQRRWLERLPEHKARVVCLDSGSEVIALESKDNPINLTTAENLAYVIYTSGSTGHPKGVMVRHRGLCNVSEAQSRVFEVGPGSRVLQFSSLSFDASIFEIVMVLLKGSTLCLGAQESLLPGPGLMRFLQQQAITLVTFPPSALAFLPVEDLPALRTITVAGETCPAELCAEWVGGRRFFNLYGPTEATIWVTAAECTDGRRKPPIGRPIANTKVYLLDRNLQPVPIGVLGELHIDGVGLARGYLHRPDLTAEMFIPNPFSDEPGARLYRTGDLAHYLPDGNIEFLGRIDHQVKIRGFRIELGEIETVLADYPGVRQSVVVAREEFDNSQSAILKTTDDRRRTTDDRGKTTEDGGPRTGSKTEASFPSRSSVPGLPSFPQLFAKRLVAYVVSKQKHSPSIPELRSFLKEKLPDYMVPSAFVFLDRLPLTPNGKVDRKALPEPDQGRPELEETYLAPRTPVEEKLAAIWREILKLERVGSHDDFFDLGGHSLLATQIISRLREAFRIELPLRALFENPTIAELAVQITEAQAKKAAPKDMADVLLTDLESLSDEETERLLAQESSRST